MKRLDFDFEDERGDIRKVVKIFKRGLRKEKLTKQKLIRGFPYTIGLAKLEMISVEPVI